MLKRVLVVFSVLMLVFSYSSGEEFKVQKPTFWNVNYPLSIVAEHDDLVLGAICAEANWGSKILVYRKPELCGASLELVNGFSAPLYLSSGAIVGEWVYLCDSKKVLCYDIASGKPFENSALGKILPCSICLVDESGKVVSVSEDGFKVLNLNNGSVDEYHLEGKQKLDLSYEYKFLEKGRGEDYFYYAKNVQTLYTLSLPEGKLSAHTGVLSFSAYDGGYAEVSSTAFKNTKKRIARIENGEIVESALSTDIQRKIRIRGWGALCLQYDNRLEAWQADKLVLNIPLASRREYDARNYPLSDCGDARFHVSEASVFVNERRTGNVYWYSLAQTDFSNCLPISSVIATSLETHNNQVQMLFADGTWASVNVDNWKIVKRVHCTSREIFSASPHNSQIAFFDGKGIYSIDANGNIRRWPKRVSEDDRILFEQGGTRALKVKIVGKFLSMGMWKKVSAYVYEARDWYESEREIKTLLGTKTQTCERTRALFWRNINFAGKGGPIVAKGSEKKSVFPADATVDMKFPEYNLLSRVWAGGFAAYSGAVRNLETGITVRSDILKIHGYRDENASNASTSPMHIAGFEIPGLPYVLFRLPNYSRKPDKVIAVSKELKNGTYEVKEFKCPDGTRWFVKHKDKLLFISTFGSMTPQP